MGNEVERANVGSALTTEINLQAFESFTGQMSGGSNIIGQLLKFNKGEWFVGKDAEGLELGTKMVVNIQSVTGGWNKWEDSKVVQQLMVPAWSGTRIPVRSVLGDLDEDTWEKWQDGRPKDPWVKTYLMILKDPGVKYAAKDAYTFSISSVGGEGAIKKFLETWMGHYKQGKTKEWPIVELQEDSYKHPDYGKVHVPLFPIVGWEKMSLFPTPGTEPAAEENEEPARVKASAKKKRAA